MWPNKRALIDICVLLITSLGDAASAFLLEFDVTLGADLTSFTRMKVGYNKYKDNAYFITCLCEAQTNCTTFAFKTSIPSDTGYKNMTLDFSPRNNSGLASYFVCSILLNDVSREYEMSCQYKTSDSITCRSGSCSVNIKMSCPKKTVILIWRPTQEALVYEGYDVTLEDCCPVTQATTTDLATTIITSTTTTITTSTTGTTTFSNTTVSEQTTLQEDTPTIQTTTSLITQPSTTPTNSTDSAPSKQDQQNGSGSSSQITDVHIGIIVGTAVAAVLLTVIVMCVIWKIKTRPRNNPSNKSNGSIHDSTNQTTSPNNAVRNETKSSKKNQQQPQPVSPQPVSNVNQEEYSEISQYCNPVEAASTVSPNNTENNVPVELQQNSAYSTALEIQEDANPSVYSHLRENNVIPANVYNLGPNEQDATLNNNVNLTGASQIPGLKNKATNNLCYSTIEHPNPGKTKTKKKNNRSTTVQYIEIDPTKKVTKGLNSHKPATGQQTANDQPSGNDQISPNKQEKPNNNYYDFDLPEPSQILPNQQTKPNNNYFEIELPDPDPITTDDQGTPTALYSNAVYSPQEKMDVNKADPMKDTDKIYFNAV